MRHRKSRRRLNRKPAASRLVVRNLTTALLLYERMRTTRKRAAAIQPVVERLIHIGRTKHPREAIRAINRVVTDENACRKIMEVLKNSFDGRPSGFTRIKSAGYREGDGAEMVDISFVSQ